MSAGLWGALAGAGLGMLQHDDKKRQYEHDKKVASETARWSPWTGMTPNKVGDAPSLVGAMGQGAMSGFKFGDQFAEKTPATPAAAAAPVPDAAPPIPGVELTSADPSMQGLNQQQNLWGQIPPRQSGMQYPVV